MFENVNYTYYSETLGRSAVPSEADFNNYADDNKMFMKWLVNDGIVTEREENGLDIAVCRMIEIDYLTAQEAIGAAAENGGSVASESINGYSYSYDKTAQQEAVKLNAKSAAAKKIDIIKLYNDYNAGVR
uniref:Head-tail connector protein n=1 Tax=Siphoviridae sp. ct8aS59 TaxID=2825365 RepID=A0A8S5TSV7_9CAUD|nr:MAG TPA: head-tail connector protein [Siphoviridae sp. ct8aS59]